MTHLRTVRSPEPRVGGPKRAQQQRPLQSLMGEEELEELPFLEFKIGRDVQSEDRSLTLT